MNRLVMIGLLLLGVINSLYAGEVLPPGETPIKIHTRFYIADIDKIDTVDQSFEARVFIRFRWQDSRLSHNEKCIIKKPLDEIWNPNIQVYNVQKAWKTAGGVADIFPDGTVHYRLAGWGSFSQKLDLTTFPFDSQSINFQLIAWGYTSAELEFVLELDLGEKLAFSMAPDSSLTDWEILDFSHDFKPFQPVHSADVFLPAARFGFEAKRLTSYYWVKIIFPLMLIVAMSWAVFWMDPLNVASNVGISMTSMLTLIAYRFSADTILPRLSYLTSLDYFILTSTLLVFLSLLQNLTTSSYAKQGRVDVAKKMDFISRVLFPVLFLVIVMETLVFRLIF